MPERRVARDGAARATGSAASDDGGDDHRPEPPAPHALVALAAAADAHVRRPLALRPGLGGATALNVTASKWSGAVL